MQVPGEVLLDEVQAEQIAQPRQHLLRALVLDAVDAVGERLPLQQLGVGAGRFDELGLVGVEERRGLGGRQLGCRAQRRRDIRDHLLHAAGEQLVLLVGAQAQLHRARGRAEVGDRLTELAEARRRGRACPRSARRRSGRGPRHPCP